MEVCVAFDGRFGNCEGKPSSHHLTYDTFSKRYLDVFTHVKIVGRYYKNDLSKGGAVEGEGVVFDPIPGYVGPREFLKNLPVILYRLWRISGENKAFILRTPGTIPFILSFFLLIRMRRFSVEVVADPYDQLSSKSNSSSMAPIFRYLYTHMLKWQCQSAYSSAYVTNSALQKRYVPGNSATFSYTSLNLSSDWFSTECKSLESDDHIISTIGMMNQSYKGIDALLKSFSLVLKDNNNIRLKIAGDGELKGSYISLAIKLGISEKVEFVGRLEGREEVKTFLDTSSLFVLASRQEGLPRVVIEAMARALPCIATNVGGIPELISESLIVEVDDIEALSRKIISILKPGGNYSFHSSLNLEKARNYSYDNVQKARVLHYEYIAKRNLK
jgi:glycosyltransferase involved in cell wall biosynthesis